MKKISFSFFLIILFAIISCDAPGENYINKRHGFSIKKPIGWWKNTSANSGDIAQFIHPEGIAHGVTTVMVFEPKPDERDLAKTFAVGVAQYEVLGITIHHKSGRYRVINGVNVYDGEIFASDSSGKIYARIVIYQKGQTQCILRFAAKEEHYRDSVNIIKQTVESFTLL